MDFVIALMIVLIMPDGSAEIEFVDQPSSDVCWVRARQFLQHNPAEFRAVGLGAGCVVKPTGTPA